MPDRTWSRPDYRAAALLFSACLLTFAYFFQGTGWGQLANFNTTRAIVERRTFDITPYVNGPGDFSHVGDRVYSNKPPGLPLVGAIVYAPLLAVERSLGARGW